MIFAIFIVLSDLQYNGNEYKYLQSAIIKQQFYFDKTAAPRQSANSCKHDLSLLLA